MTISASSNLAHIVNGQTADATYVNGELAWIESRALDGTATAGDTMQGPMNYALDTGAVNAYVVSLNPALTTLTIGIEVKWKVSVANTGASTLNVNGTGAKAIVKGVNTALTSGDLPINSQVATRYDGSNWVIQNALGITTAQISPTANIIGTQLSASANILGSQLSASAAIAGSQLASLGVNNIGILATIATASTNITIPSAGNGWYVFVSCSGNYVTTNNSAQAILLYANSGTGNVLAQELYIQIDTSSLTVSALPFSLSGFVGPLNPAGTTINVNVTTTGGNITISHTFMTAFAIRIY